MNLKCVKNNISFDGINFLYRGKVVGKAPDDLVFSRRIPRHRIDHIKDDIVKHICEV